MFFLVFHGTPRWTHGAGHGHGHDDGHHGGEPHESPWVVTLPLIALALPSVVLGAITIGPMLFGDVFRGVIHVDAGHPAMATLAAHYHGALALALHSVQTLPFWLALSGVGLSAYFYLMKPSIPQAIQTRFAALHHVMEQKYFMDRFNEVVFAGGARLLGTQLWKRTDQGLIDGFMVNGSARVVAAVASIMRIGQSGYLYHYAIAMILGVALLLWWFAPVMVSSTAMVK
jgi:NADH-quinone oxidoreductase subunit L